MNNIHLNCATKESCVNQSLPAVERSQLVVLFAVINGNSPSLSFVVVAAAA